MIDEQQVDELLYEGFVDDADRAKMSAVRAASPEKLAKCQPTFQDERLKTLLPLYKARNFPEILNDYEKTWWLKFRQQKLLNSGRLKDYQTKLGEMLKSSTSTADKNLLKELQDYSRLIEPKA